LPAESFNLAVEAVVAYEEGELNPPRSEAHQRHRRTVTSTLNFLVRLDPLKERDAVQILQKFLNWRETGIRPSRECSRESGTNKVKTLASKVKTLASKLNLNVGMFVREFVQGRFLNFCHKMMSKN